MVTSGLTLSIPKGMVGHMASRKGRSRTTRLSRDAWIEAALRAWTDEGIAAVAVVPLAARLGVTKGSFYWHFDSRAELITAALERWEQRGTAGRFEPMERLADPRDRLRAAIAAVAADPPRLMLDFHVHVAADEPLVAPFARRVNARWIQWLTAQYAALGNEADEARARALQTYATYVGFLRILATDPAVLPPGPARERHAAFLSEQLIP